jgi:hypothetical protein
MWKALYFLGGSSWAVLRQAELGFITADNGYNRGEAYTANEIHPVLPPSAFDKGYLRINGSWSVWDAGYQTNEARDDPYEFDIITRYNRFIIYSPVIYLPLIARL